MTGCVGWWCGWLSKMRQSSSVLNYCHLHLMGEMMTPSSGQILSCSRRRGIWKTYASHPSRWGISLQHGDKWKTKDDPPPKAAEAEVAQLTGEDKVVRMINKEAVAEAVAEVVEGHPRNTSPSQRSIKS